MPKRADRRIDRVASARHVLWAMNFPAVVSMSINQLLKALVCLLAALAADHAGSLTGYAMLHRPI